MNVNCNPETWSWKDGTCPLHGAAGGRDSDPEAARQLRAGGPVAASSIGRELGDFCLGRRELAGGLKPGYAAAGRDRGSGARSRLQGAIRETNREKGRLVHDSRRRFSGGDIEDDAVSAGLARRHRSFPSKQLSKGVGEWNHYYVRCINGEVRLWVNGEEVSGGTGCEPRAGYLCLESEGRRWNFASCGFGNCRETVGSRVAGNRAVFHGLH